MRKGWGCGAYFIYWGNMNCKDIADIMDVTFSLDRKSNQKVSLKGDTPLRIPAVSFRFAAAAHSRQEIGGTVTAFCVQCDGGRGLMGLS